MELDSICRWAKGQEAKNPGHAPRCGGGWDRDPRAGPEARAIFSELKNLCIWNKTNGGMGSFYRSMHELVFVFKIGRAPHTNSFGLGETGRYRTNVWDYAGINAWRPGRAEELATHPTVKPVALVADAIKDCSRCGEIVLDLFGGSGATLIAAERTGRQARLGELRPACSRSSRLRVSRGPGTTDS